jgi:hypothetical protein
MNISAANELALHLANHPNQVASMTVTYQDGFVSTGWYASNIQLKQGRPVITLKHHPSMVFERPDTLLNTTHAHKVLVQMSNGQDFTFGQETPPPFLPITIPPPSPPTDPKSLIGLLGGPIPTLFRALCDLNSWRLVAQALPNGGFRPRLFDVQGKGTLRMFTSQETAVSWANAQPEPIPIMPNQCGADLFANAPDVLLRIEIDPGSPLQINVEPDQISHLREIARSIRLERLLDPPPEDRKAFWANLRSFGQYKLFMYDSGEAGFLPVSIKNDTGIECAALFTCSDIANKFPAHVFTKQETHLTTFTGEELFTWLPNTGLTWFVFNIGHPSAPPVSFPITFCSAIMS